MQKGWRIAALVFVCLSTGKAALAQSEVKKFEVGGQFSYMHLGEELRHEPGFGGRFTYNITDYLSLEAEMNLFPRDRRGPSGSNPFFIRREGGRVTQGLFGVKAGKRFERFGVFAKARPGFVSFGEVFKQARGSITNPQLDFGRVTHFAFDVGGVAEIYTSRRTLVRFDVGDTIIHYRDRSGDLLDAPFIIFGKTRHNIQASVGFSYRF